MFFLDHCYILAQGYNLHIAVTALVETPELPKYKRPQKSSNFMFGLCFALFSIPKCPSHQFVTRYIKNHLEVT